MNPKAIYPNLESIERLFLGQKTILTSKEAAAYLSIKLSTLYKMTSAGRLPYAKPNGKHIYFKKAELDNWMLSNKTHSDEEKNTEAETYVNTHR